MNRISHLRTTKPFFKCNSQVSWQVNSFNWLTLLLNNCRKVKVHYSKSIYLTQKAMTQDEKLQISNHAITPSTSLFVLSCCWITTRQCPTHYGIQKIDLRKGQHQPIKNKASSSLIMTHFKGRRILLLVKSTSWNRREEEMK